MQMHLASWTYSKPALSSSAENRKAEKTPHTPRGACTHNTAPTQITRSASPTHSGPRQPVSALKASSISILRARTAARRRWSISKDNKAQPTTVRALLGDRVRPPARRSTPMPARCARPCPLPLGLQLVRQTGPAPHPTRTRTRASPTRHHPASRIGRHRPFAWLAPLVSRRVAAVHAPASVRPCPRLTRPAIRSFRAI